MTPTLAFLAGLGMMEILVIVALITLLFGAKKIPELARSLGGSMKAFKKGLAEGESSEEKSSKNTTKKE